MDAIKVRDLYDLNHTRAVQMREGCEYPWEALCKIKETVLAIGVTLDEDVYERRGDDVWIAKSASIAPTAISDRHILTGICIVFPRNSSDLMLHIRRYPHSLPQSALSLSSYSPP